MSLGRRVRHLLVASLPSLPAPQNDCTNTGQTHSSSPSRQQEEKLVPMGPLTAIEKKLHVLLPTLWETHPNGTLRACACADACPSRFTDLLPLGRCAGYNHHSRRKLLPVHAISRVHSLRCRHEHRCKRRQRYKSRSPPETVQPPSRFFGCLLSELLDSHLSLFVLPSLSSVACPSSPTQSYHPIRLILEYNLRVVPS